MLSVLGSALLFSDGQSRPSDCELIRALGVGGVFWGGGLLCLLRKPIRLILHQFNPLV